MNDILRKITLNPISLAILIGMAIILLLPDIFDKYKYEKEVYDTNKFMFEKTYYVADLDSDSIDEFILSFAYENKHSIQVLTHDKGIVDQWNTHMNLPYGKKRLCIGDYDKDGFKEFYAFSDNNDTIFLFCYEPLDTIHPMWINNHPLLELTREFNEPDYMFNHIELRDINMDGHPDLFFVINSGKARFPRNLCYYDIKNDTLIRSEDIGNTFNQGATIEDINGDGKPEIYGNVCASGQVHDSLGYDYSDYSSWIFVYNNDLELVFDPLEFKNFRNFVNVEHIVIDQQDYWLFTIIVE